METVKKTGIPLLTDWKAFLKSGQRIFVGSNAATPHALVGTLMDQAAHFSDVEIVHILTLGATPWAHSRFRQSFRVNALFLGKETRDAVAAGVADYTPCFLSEIPSLFNQGVLPLDVALIQVSPPDVHGYCSLGVAVDIVSAACKSARHVIAQINPNMPRTYGQSFIHKDRIDAAIWQEAPIPELPVPEADEVTDRIGRYVSLLIEDGATLQLGIGKIPNAVLKCLTEHKHLGIHTEMFSDGIIDLIQHGIIDNSMKTIHPGKSVVTFCMGTKRLYDFVNENPHMEFHPSEYVNSPVTIARNDRMVAINSAIEVDLTGQVVADSMGTRFFSGIGGQVDFIRGAAMSKEGRPIIALPSTAKGGTVSRIVPYLSQGSGVVTSRGDVHYVVTEFGIATLRGKSIRERALELIQVAHPKFREELLAQVRSHFWVPNDLQPKETDLEELGPVEMTKIKAGGHKFYVRPLRPADERGLQEFFYSHDPQTLFLRYRHQPKNLPREKAASLVNIDRSEGVALCVVTRKGPKEVIRAVGRYFLLDQGRLGELAFVVDPRHRRKGLATMLLNRMVEIGRARRVQRLIAFTLKENKPMVGILEKSNFQRLPSEDPKELYYALDLQALPVSTPAPDSEEVAPPVESTTEPVGGEAAAAQPDDAPQE
ncbi:MAG: GNAT family N-acetyltransferase [Magnetococcales bacterium]|nr:GNAT family N-acetyltransferase [Magnetococcales bacterium]